MKHLNKLLATATVIIVLLATACTTNQLDGGIDVNNELSRTLPEEITVSFDDATSRIQLDEQCRTTWTEDDELSVFYFSDANNRFLFMGDTGDRNGALVVEDNRMSEATAEIDKVVLVYPYSDDYKLNATTKSIGITIPGTQHYLNGSYGVGANIMTSVGTTNDFALKSVCGWIKVQLTGAASVTQVTLTGNSKEQLAGDATLYYEENRLALLGEDGGPDDSSQVGGTLFFGEYVRTITLDCGDGIALDSTTPTEFYFVLAPQTFDEGITIEATLSDGTTITKSTSKSITVERNVITPMASFDVQPTNEIWYTSTDGNIVEPHSEGVEIFGANIVSNTYENGKGVIKFDGDVTKIGDRAFEECLSLASISIPQSVTLIGRCAFDFCRNIESFNIPSSVTNIELLAFGNSGLTHITIPSNIKTLHAPFGGCHQLKEVVIDNNIEIDFIDDSIFNGCSRLTTFKGRFASEDGRCLIIDGVLNSFAPSGITEYTIPDGVIEIGVNAFDGCSSLTSITIPDSVTSIGQWAFEGCRKLTHIGFGNGVTSISFAAFRYCTSLTSVTIPNCLTSIGSSVFEFCSSLEKFEGKFASEDGRSLIVDGKLKAFAPAGITEYAIPDSVTSIGDNAFYACSSLASITIPDSVTSIGSSAFSGCSSLTNITIPVNVSEIHTYAFGDCSNLVNVYCKMINPSKNEKGVSYWNAFDDNASGRKIYVPTESVEAYKAAEYWSDYADAFVPYDFEKGEVVNLENRKIYYTSTSGNVVTPYATNVFGANIISNTYANGQGVITFDGDVTKIGNQAFYNCSSLANITIPDSVTSIEWSAFSDCTSLTSITIPDSVTSIGYRTFYNCSSLVKFEGKFASEDGRCLIMDRGDGTYLALVAFAPAGLTEYTIPDNITEIGSYVFNMCSSLESVTIPDSVTSIEYAAFAHCTSLTSITIPDNVTSIRELAFYDCTSLAKFEGKFTSEDDRCLIVDGVLHSFAPAGLTEYTIPEGVTSIGKGAFSDCTSLTSVTIPEGVTSIGDDAFYDCSSLTSITIPEGVTSIESSTFSGCSSLAEVYCKPTTPPTADFGSNNYWRAFGYNASGRKIYVPTESVEAYKAADGWSEYADAIVGYDFE